MERVRRRRSIRGPPSWNGRWSHRIRGRAAVRWAVPPAATWRDDLRSGPDRRAWIGSGVCDRIANGRAGSATSAGTTGRSGSTIGLPKTSRWTGRPKSSGSGRRTKKRNFAAWNCARWLKIGRIGRCCVGTPSKAAVRPVSRKRRHRHDHFEFPRRRPERGGSPTRATVQDRGREGSAGVNSSWPPRPKSGPLDRLRRLEYTFHDEPSFPILARARVRRRHSSRYRARHFGFRIAP